MSSPRIQATFERSTRNFQTNFISNQDYFELPERTITAKGISFISSNPIGSKVLGIFIKTKLVWK